MGLCASSDNLSPEEAAKAKAAKKRNDELVKELNQEAQADEHVSKLLLLGAGESGKSTLFKQMIEIYGNGYPQAKRMTFIPTIYGNLLTAMQKLLEKAEDYGGIEPANQASADFVAELSERSPIVPDVVHHFKILLADKGVQKAFEHRADFQLIDSAQYFFERLDIICSKDYCPDKQDVLRSRVRTTGIVENAFTIQGNQFKMFDVGGQRNERKKWIHCFESVTAVLFVAALSAYDQKLYEDIKTNRMDEALTLFKDITHLKWFINTPVVLFLNKRDLFEEKVQRVPLTVCFDDYDGDNHYDDALNFIKYKFKTAADREDNKLYVHVTCATDTSNVQAVFNIVKDIIINEALHNSGML